MTALKVRHITYTLVLLGGCVWPSKYEREEVTLERIAMRDAWLQTLVPFALVVCLVLLLLVLYYRRNAPAALDGLFRPRRAPDLVGAIRRWWRNRRELEPFEGLLRLERHRIREAERARRREAQRAATREAERADREAQRRVDEWLRALPPLGPPRLGFFSRFGIGLLTGLLLTTAMVLPFARDMSGWGALFVLFGGGAGVLISLIASFVCALVVTLLEAKTIWSAMLCGLLGAIVSRLVMPEIWFVTGPTVLSIGGSAIGLAIGAADQLSRRPGAN